MDQQQHNAGTNTAVHAGRADEVCAHCGRRLPPGHRLGALLPDSTVIDPHRQGRDGRRYVTACGSEHLQLLIDQARRDWNPEQLWFGQLCRASTQPGMHGHPITDLAERARLSPADLRRAMAWNAQGSNPRTALPGGQRLPTSPPRSH